MPLDLSVLPSSVREAIASRGFTTEEAEKLSPEQAFIEYCEWNGLIRWGHKLWRTVEDLNKAQQTKPLTLSFDLWRNDRWCGMAKGNTVQEARQMVVDSELHGHIVMTPFYGLGTSKETYKAITGRDAI